MCVHIVYVYIYIYIYIYVCTHTHISNTLDPNEKFRVQATVENSCLDRKGFAGSISRIRTWPVTSSCGRLGDERHQRMWRQGVGTI